MALPIAQAVPLPRAQSSRKLNAAIQVQVISNKMSILFCQLLQGDQSTGCPLKTQINMNLCSKLTPLKMVQNILGKATPPLLPSPLIWAMRRRAFFLWEDFPYEKGHLAG